MLCCQGLSKVKVEPSIRSPEDVFRCFRHLSYPPSKEDQVLMARMVGAGKIIGIDLLDHIIVGHLRYAGAKEDGWI